MPDFRVEHTFNCSQEAFWNKLMFDEEYNRQLFKERLKFLNWREVRREDTGDQVRRVVEAAPPIGDLPGPLKALVGEGAGYEERGLFDRKTNRYTAEVVPNVLADKLTVRIEVTTQPSGEGRCLRIVKGSVNAKIFGVGGMLEKRMIADLEKSYAKSAEFTNEYVAKHDIR